MIVKEKKRRKNPVAISLTQKTSVQTSENVSTFSPRSPPATVEATLTTAAAAKLTTAITATTGATVVTLKQQQQQHQRQ